MQNTPEIDPARTPSTVVHKMTLPFRLPEVEAVRLGVKGDVGLEVFDYADGGGLLVAHYRYRRPLRGGSREATCVEEHGSEDWTEAREDACAEAKATVLRLLRARSAGGAQ